MKRKRADASIVDASLQLDSNENRSSTPENVVSVSWNDVIETFANEFHSLKDVLVRNRKVHLDFCEEKGKTIDTPNNRVWISVLIMDALIYYVNINNKKKRVRRSFNQHQVLADAIWKCYMDQIHTTSMSKGPLDPISGSTNSVAISDSSVSSRMTRQRVSAKITENFQYKFKLIVPHSWRTYNNLKDSLQRNATRKMGPRCTNSIRYYCSHPILRQHNSLRHLVGNIFKEVLQLRHNSLYRSNVSFQVVYSPETTHGTRSSSNISRESRAMSPLDDMIFTMYHDINYDCLLSDGLDLFSESNDTFNVPPSNEGAGEYTTRLRSSTSIGRSSSSSSKNSGYSLIAKD